MGDTSAELCSRAPDGGRKKALPPIPFADNMLLCFRDHGQASPVALALFVRIICVLAPGSSALAKGRLRAAVSLSCTAFLPPARCQPRGADASRAFAPSTMAQRTLCVMHMLHLSMAHQGW